MTKETCLQFLLVVGVLAFLAYAVTMLRFLFPALLFGSRAPATREARQALVDEICASGDSLAAISCSGQVGTVSVRGPLLSVDVRPSGVIFVPPFGSSAVRAEVIKQLKYEEGTLHRGMKIVHHSRSIASPIFLGGISKGSAVAQALESITANEQPTTTR